MRLDRFQKKTCVPGNGFRRRRIAERKSPGSCYHPAMRYLKAFGFLALALMLVPMMWQGYEELDGLIDNPGGVCIIDGDLARRVATAYPVADNAQGIPLVKGPNGSCQLENRPSQTYSHWRVDGDQHAEGYGGGAALANAPFPPLEWEWDVALSWASPLQTLQPYGWAARFLAPTMGLMPLACIVCGLALALRAFMGRDVLEDDDDDIFEAVEDYD